MKDNIRFSVKKVKVKKCIILNDVQCNYYICVDGKMIIGNPLTKYYAKLICEWLNSVKESQWNEHYEEDNND